jgi:hypothetical protein
MQVLPSDVSQSFQHEQPSRQGKGAEQSGEHDCKGGYGALVSEIFRHDEAASRGGASQHYQYGYELFAAEAQLHGYGQEYGAEHHQLQSGDAQRNSSNSVVSIKFNSNGAYMITPAIDSLASLEFKYRSGGSKKQVEVAYQIGSGDWQAVDTLVINSSSS